MNYAIQHRVYLRACLLPQFWPASPADFNEIYTQKWVIVQVISPEYRVVEVPVSSEICRILRLHVSQLTYDPDMLYREPIAEDRPFEFEPIATGQKVGLSLRGLGSVLLRREFDYLPLRWPRDFPEAKDFSSKRYWFLGYNSRGASILKLVGTEQTIIVPAECMLRLTK